VKFLLTALTPTPEQIMSWHYVSTLLLGIVAAFLVIAWVLDRGIDLGVAVWNRRATTVIHFEARRAELRRATGSK
jgi:hypothetical protein